MDLFEKNQSKDCFKFFQKLRAASKSAKEYAARTLARKFARDNLKQLIKTKSGKEILGRMLSKNIYLKEVSYMRGAKTISYIQARNIKSGQVVSYKTAVMLISKYWD